MSIRIRADRGALWIVPVAMGAALVLTAGIAGLGYVFFSPPDGPPIATHDIQTGQPFELKFPATGESARVWLDMKCDSCGFRVEGP